jgi:hypothetical protein
MDKTRNYRVVSTTAGRYCLHTKQACEMGTSVCNWHGASPILSHCLRSLQMTLTCCLSCIITEVGSTKSATHPENTTRRQRPKPRAEAAVGHAGTVPRWAVKKKKKHLCIAIKAIGGCCWLQNGGTIGQSSWADGLALVGGGVILAGCRPSVPEFSPFPCVCCLLSPSSLCLSSFKLGWVGLV